MHKTSGGPRAGFGVFWRDPRNEALALSGTEQTAQKAEVAAVVRAIMKAKKPIDIISDSRYTVGGTEKLVAGQISGNDWRHKERW